MALCADGGCFFAGLPQYNDFCQEHYNKQGRRKKISSSRTLPQRSSSGLSSSSLSSSSLQAPRSDNRPPSPTLTDLLASPDLNSNERNSAPVPNLSNVLGQPALVQKPSPRSASFGRFNLRRSNTTPTTSIRLLSQRAAPPIPTTAASTSVAMPHSAPTTAPTTTSTPDSIETPIYKTYQKTKPPHPPPSPPSSPSPPSATPDSIETPLYETYQKTNPPNPPSLPHHTKNSSSTTLVRVNRRGKAASIDSTVLLLNVKKHIPKKKSRQTAFSHNRQTSNSVHVGPIPQRMMEKVGKRIEFIVKQKQRMGFKSDAVLRIDTSLQLLSILKARTKQEKQSGKSSKSYPCDAISEMTEIGTCKLSIIIADGTHNNKGTKKEFEFLSRIYREQFVTAMNEQFDITVNKHRSLRHAVKLVQTVNNLGKTSLSEGNNQQMTPENDATMSTTKRNSSNFSKPEDNFFEALIEEGITDGNDKPVRNDGNGTLLYRPSSDIGRRQQKKVAVELAAEDTDDNGRHVRTSSMSRLAMEAAALSVTNLYHGEQYVLSVDHVLVMGQQSDSVGTFASGMTSKKEIKTLAIGVRGQIVVTNYRVLFDAYNSPNQRDYDIPMATITSLSVNKKMGKGTGSRPRSCTLTIKQTGWKPTFQFQTQPDLDKFALLVRHHSFLDTAADPSKFDTFFAFQYTPTVKDNDENNGWLFYDPIADYKRIGMIDDSTQSIVDAPYRIFDNNFQLSITYPNIFCIPRTIDDDTLRKAAEYRSRKRTVATVWMDSETRVSLARCAQPMRGITNKQSIDDQHLILAMPLLCIGEAKGNTLWFVDARKKLAAIANKAKGKGTEKVNDYPNTELLHLNIENIHHMRRSLDEYTDVCEPLNNNAWDEDWFSKIDASLWLRHCRLVLGGSHEIVRLMQIEKCCVVCHCSDGWDRTAQLCATAELLMDPWYRSCKGFAVLIEKEWLSFGHKFHDRIGHGDGTGYPGSQERSPIFVQWIDCVYQIIQQFPCAFEFTEEFLLCIVDHHLSCCYGTFLYNSEWERRARNLASKTTSLWSDLIGRNNEKPELYNERYNLETTDRILYPACSMRNLSVWKNLWLRRDK